MDERALKAKPWPRYEAASLGFRNYWYPAALSRKLKKKPVSIRILGEDLVLLRHQGKAYALEDRCPHRGIPLSKGRCEFPGTPTISCCYHGWTFDITNGRLVAAITDGPESPLSGKVCVTSYPVEEKSGIIWVYIGDGKAVPLDEDVPEDLLQPDSVVVGRITVRKGNWRLAAENGIDAAHATYFHRNAWVAFPLKFPAWQGRILPDVQGRWFGTKANLVWQCEYPGLGIFPRWGWWKRVQFGVRSNIIVHLRLPCLLRVTCWPRPGSNHYEWYEPIDEQSHRYFQVKVKHASGLGALWFRVEYQLLWRWLADRQFNGQDGRAIEMMETFYTEQDGWNRERLFRQDQITTAWRKFASETGRAVQRAYRAKDGGEEAPREDWA
jgi:phenylpropionate dioxygenase-like ring-hydroxylating dioxygenase large terminal subunit